jgi:phytoene dehydrogenase-like protein
MRKTPQVVVVGGGLAGLVAARHLAGAGLDTTLLERNDAVGGRVRTREKDGFRLDRGFQVLFPNYPAVRAELDLDTLDLRRFSPGAALAYPGRRSTLADPLRKPRSIPETLSSGAYSIGDAVRLARLGWDLARTDLDSIFDEPGADGTIEAFLRDRGFSDRFVEEFIAPFYGGITLDRSLTTSKRVFEYTFRTLMTCEAAVPAAGMGEIPAQLVAEASIEGATIETGVEVTTVSGAEIDGRNGSVAVRTAAGEREADAVIVATDPPAARELTAVESIPTAAQACVTQYYTLPTGTDFETGKKLLLNASGTDPNHVVPHSEVAPEYAPSDTALLSATFLGERDETDAELAEKTHTALESWYPDRRFDDLETLHTDRIPFAQFTQPPGIHERLPGPRKAGGGVYLAGDYTRWSSIQGAIESGRRAARAVLEDVSAA